MSEELKEKAYLKKILTKIDQAIATISKRVSRQKKDINVVKDHLREHKRDMDNLEKNAIRETVGQIAMIGEAALQKRKRLFRLKDIPYFGRIDFKENEA